MLINVKEITEFVSPSLLFYHIETPLVLSFNAFEVEVLLFLPLVLACYNAKHDLSWCQVPGQADQENGSYIAIKEHAV